MGKRCEVEESRRTIVYDNDARLDLHNVTAFDKTGTHLRLWCDEGIVITNPDRVLYHLIQADSLYDQDKPTK